MGARCQRRSLEKLDNYTLYKTPLAPSARCEGIFLPFPLLNPNPCPIFAAFNYFWAAPLPALSPRLSGISYAHFGIPRCNLTAQKVFPK